MGIARQTGISLLELMTALAIVAIGSGSALPLLDRSLERQRLRSHGLALLGSLQYARAEALRRNQPVYLCAANLKRNRELQGCLPPQAGPQAVWPEGALVFADRGAGNGYYDSGERLKLAMFDGARVAVRAPARQLALTAEGRLRDAGTLEFRLAGVGGRQCLALTVAEDGRARLGAVSDDCR